jgi:hypothetical protein
MNRPIVREGQTTGGMAALQLKTMGQTERGALGAHAQIVQSGGVMQDNR